jgi:hypothetical protein
MSQSLDLLLEQQIKNLEIENKALTEKVLQLSLALEISRRTSGETKEEPQAS